MAPITSSWPASSRSSALTPASRSRSGLKVQKRCGRCEPHGYQRHETANPYVWWYTSCCEPAGLDEHGEDMKRGRGSTRHPTVEDHVVIGTGATILGPITIGAYSKIGAQALVIESLPPHSIVLGHAGSIIHRSPDDTITTVEQPVDDSVV
jgi:hypothetical protein